MTEPSNAVLSEQVKSLRKDFYEFKRMNKAEMKEMHERVERTREIANEVNYSVRYVKESVDKMDSMMSKFISVVGDQNEKIDTFINSDKRMSHKRQFWVSVAQVASGIIIAVITIWGAGKL